LKGWLYCFVDANTVFKGGYSLNFMLHKKLQKGKFLTHDKSVVFELVLFS